MIIHCIMHAHLTAHAGKLPGSAVSRVGLSHCAVRYGGGVGEVALAAEQRPDRPGWSPGRQRDGYWSKCEGKGGSRSCGSRLELTPHRPDTWRPHAEDGETHMEAL